MGITHPRYKAAVVQAAPVWIDLEGTVAKTIRYIEEAVETGRLVFGQRRTLRLYVTSAPYPS